MSELPTLRSAWRPLLAAALLFGACSGLLSWGVLRLSYWWLANCTKPSPACTAGGLVVDYWWAPFFLLALLVGLLLFRWLTPKQQS
jgi:hypothetical protein